MCPNAMPRLLLALLLAAAMGCRSGPQPIRYGHDACTHCRMTISDKRYGAELVSPTGKTYPFDAVECMAAYVQAHAEQAGEMERWVVPFDAPGTLIPADSAFFLHSPVLRSPMGQNLTAFGPGTSRAAAFESYGGEVLTWPQVLALVDGDGAAASAPLHP